jgi:predicted dehydrogenase
VGRRWQARYRAAILALPRHFAIRAVCDPVAWRAEEEARQQQCELAAGPTELLENPGVEAVLVLDAPWYRLWPIEAACRFGKPILCAAVQALESQGERLTRLVEQHHLAVMTALQPRLAGPTMRLRELLQSELGPARQLLCDFSDPDQKPRRTPQGNPAALLGPAGPAVVDWCLSLADCSPVSVQTVEGPGLTSVLIDLGEGRVAQIVRRRSGFPCPRLRLEVVAQRGGAVIVLPNRLSFRTRAGTHLCRLPGGPPHRLLLESFHKAVTQGGSLVPDLSCAWRAVRCLVAAQQSRLEGRRVMVG